VYPQSITGFVYGKQAGAYDFAVDVWSLAVLLWELLSGESPFKTRRTEKANFNAKLKDLDYRPLRESGVSNEAAWLLTQMLELDPARRPTVGQCREHRWFNISLARLALAEMRPLQTETEWDETDRPQDVTYKKMMSETRQPLR